MENKFNFTPTPKNCDLCKVVFSAEPGTLMYDALTPYGVWGCVCDGCFQSLGMRLGTGFGQKYVREADGHFWHKPA